MRAGIIFAVAGAVCAQSLPDPTDVLAHARDRLLERRHRLPNYTSAQNVDRQYLRPFVQPQPAPSCREMREGVKPAGPREESPVPWHPLSVLVRANELPPESEKSSDERRLRPRAGIHADLRQTCQCASQDRYVVPRGFESNWITIAAPPK